MKIRTGFVSNSSSSSFIIAAKGELTEDRVFDAMGVDENSMFSSFAREIAGTLVREAYDTIKSVEDLLYIRGYDTLSEWHEYYDGSREEKWLAEGYTLHEGSASDQEDNAEYWICRNGIHLEADGLIVHCEGGY